MLFTGDYEGLVAKPVNCEIEVVEVTHEHVIVKAGAGVVWDDFVAYTVRNGWGGLENLSYIPGSVGACPVQNIGAYGVEVKDTLFSVEGYYLDTFEPFILSNTQCNFGYRNSIFKNELRNKVFIWAVSFKLAKNPVVNTSYGNLSKELEGFSHVNIANVRDVVINVRRSKLPDPAEAGNAGSFFKNPSINKELAEQLVSNDSKMPYFDNPDGSVKIPAAYLIEQCGWKGFRKGDAGVHHKQCLVLVNHGKATGLEIIDLANEIIASVLERYGIKLDSEVNIF